mmetsp:Transcript_1635/g.3825  ORF Transcript_1635/g.3825 Transcript_1635/m.3825 type:complete len:253 (+) Transcript_1635:318-1076(+)
MEIAATEEQHLAALARRDAEHASDFAEWRRKRDELLATLRKKDEALATAQNHAYAQAAEIAALQARVEEARRSGEELGFQMELERKNAREAVEAVEKKFAQAEFAHRKALDLDNRAAVVAYRRDLSANDLLEMQLRQMKQTSKRCHRLASMDRVNTLRTRRSVAMAELARSLPNLIGGGNAGRNKDHDALNIVPGTSAWDGGQHEALSKTPNQTMSKTTSSSLFLSAHLLPPQQLNRKSGIRNLLAPPPALA